MAKGWKVRDYILWYTQFYDTCVIPEYGLVEAVNKEFKLSYQLNMFRERYIDKMPQFKKWKGEDGYWMYERTDIDPDPYWTLSYLLEMEESFKENELYQENEDFINYIEYAKRHNYKDFENYILLQRVLELEEKVRGRL